MRLYRYLNESRSKAYSKDKITEILEKHCNQAIESYKKNDSMILRAVDSPADYLLTDPKKGGTRKSAFSAGNYYTLGLDNSELWDKFPDREIICASGHRAIEHGSENTYYVFPFDNAKIGVCPMDDIGLSFKELEEMGLDGDQFNRIMNQLLGESADQEDGEEIKDAMKKLTPDDILEDELEIPGTAFNLINSGKESGENLYSFLTDLLDPKSNDFDLQKISKYTYGMKDNREVWTDSPCVLIKRDEKTDSVVKDLGIDTNIGDKV